MPVPIVLTEAPITVQIVAALLSRFPAPVQLVITNMPEGAEFVVTGVAGEFVWPVNAGRGVSNGEQVVLIDLVPPVNTPVRYQVTVAGETYLSNPVTVTIPGDFIAQTLAGGAFAIPLSVNDGGFERDYPTRTAVFQIPGRRRPVVRFDTVTDGGSSVQVTTDREGSRELVEVLESGGPVVFRQTGVRDLELVETVIVTDVKSVSEIDDLRTWTLGYTFVDNPEPAVASVVYTWEDFDRVYAGRTWSDFDSEWSGRTWADFDTEEWLTE